MSNPCQALEQQLAALNAQLTVLKGGLPVLMHAYTYRLGDPKDPTTKPSNLFRIPSVSNAFTCAAVNALYGYERLHPGDKIFPKLGITKPLQLLGMSKDPKIDTITIQQLVDHQGGWNPHSAVGTVPGTNWDPVFEVRTIAQRMGLSAPPTKRQIAQYMYGKPLQFAPGLHRC